MSTTGRLYIVTVRRAPNPGHNPAAKVVAPCPHAAQCTDATGEHHSFLALGTSVADVLAHIPPGLHITRVEEASMP